MSLKKILVIEDNLKHLSEVKNFIDERVHAGADVEARFVSTFEEAKEAMDTEQYDGIISDVFFPDHEGSPPDPETPAPTRNETEQLDWAENVGGVKLVREARTRRIPFILCTSTYHHGEKTQPVTAWLRKNSADFVVDASHEVGSGEADRKDWQSAFVELAYLRSLLDHKFFEFDETGRIERPSSFGELRDRDQNKFNELMPLFKALKDPRSNQLPVAADEIADGIKKEKLHTMDPVLIEILDGPGKGLVQYSSEAPTLEEILEKATEQSWFSDELHDLAIPEESGLRKRRTAEEIADQNQRGAEKYVEVWNEKRPKIEQLWGEWSKLTKEGVEGTETELPKRKLK